MLVSYGLHTHGPWVARYTTSLTTGVFSAPPSGVGWIFRVYGSLREGRARALRGNQGLEFALVIFSIFDFPLAALYFGGFMVAAHTG